MQAQSAPAGFAILHSFNRADGDKPGWIVRKADGTIYGVTALGGDGQNSGLGVLYKIASGGGFSVVHAFSDIPDGSDPGKLFLAASGTVYGITGSGGALAGGTVFIIDAAGTYSVIHSFDPETEGAGPSWLFERADGSFYGTNATRGVAASCPLNHANGTLFSMTASGSVTLMHTFCENIDGSQPGSVIVAGNGLLYGTCLQDGPLDGDNSNGGGTFWRAKPSGKVKLLHAFGPQTLGGDQPVAPLGIVQAPNGYFYGAANAAGGHSNGAIFHATAKGRVKTIHGFSARRDRGRRSGEQLRPGE